MAAEIARWKWPDRGGQAELISLVHQAQQFVTGDRPTRQKLDQVTTKMLDLYPKADLPWAFYPSGKFNKVGFELSYETSVAAVESDASPGVPFVMLGCATNGEVFQKYSSLVKTLVYQRIMLLATTRDLPDTAEKRVELGFCDPVRVFVKFEPHKPEKVATGRLRLISSVSLVDQLCERILYSKQNNAEIAQWEVCPSKPGMGLDDTSLAKIYASFSTMQRPCEADMSGWDFGMQEWEMEWEAGFRAKLAGAESTPFATAMLNRVRCESLTLFMLSDGQFIAQRVAGKRCSGSYNTSAGNSRCRVMLGLLVGARSIFAMGDDSVEDVDLTADEAKAAYLAYGHVVKDWRECSRSSFGFCSTQLTKVNGTVKGEPLNWSRMTYRMLYATHDLESRLAQFVYETRGHKMADLLTSEVGRLVQLNVDTRKAQCARGGAQMSATKKKQPKKKKQPSGKSAPMAVAFSAPKKKSKMKSENKRGLTFTITHREYLEEVKTSSAGVVNNFTYNINAALIDSFPWLGVIGGNFQKYYFSKLLWEFTPSCATTTPGNLVMATNPDTHDPLFSSYEEFLGAQGSTQTNVWQKVVHNSLAVRDCGRVGLCRSSAVPSGADSNLYDAGNFQLQVAGSTPSITVGRLSVFYTVHFTIPVVNGGSDGAAYYYQNDDVEFTPSEWAYPLTLVEPLIKYGPTLFNVHNQSTLQFLRPGIYELFINLWDVVGGSTFSFVQNPSFQMPPGYTTVEPSSVLNRSWAGNVASGSLLITYLIYVGTSGVLASLWGSSPTDTTWGAIKVGIESVGSYYTSPGAFLSMNGELELKQAESVVMRVTKDKYVQRLLVEHLTKKKVPRVRKLEGKEGPTSDGS